jgi:hydrogenase nickel incorporation protein HypB
MCATCGCGEDPDIRLIAFSPGTSDHEHEHSHAHPHDHTHTDGHTHPHDHDHTAADGQFASDNPVGRELLLEQQLLAKNDLSAERNRGWFEGRGIFAINMMSSPGSGKTTILERTIREIGEEVGLSVIEGDQETPFDAERIRAAGRPVVQINTGVGCHLDADMVARALRMLDPGLGSTVFIENVGNLVCPAMFDLGEQDRVVVASVTEGADKPLKYPHMFRDARLVLVNKIDLLPYVDFQMETFERAVKLINPVAEVLPLSATRGDGCDAWYGWIRERQSGLGAATTGLVAREP